MLTGVQGVRWYDLIIGGEPCHAGPTPMESRKDPFMGALPILQACYELAEKYGPDGRVTFGDIQAQPGSRNTVPERLIINVDLRHPDADILDKMDAIFREKVISECDSRGLTSEVNELWHMPVTKFDDECINTVRSVTEQLGYSYREMVSGAGHDSLYVAKVVPTSMIFVPCENGISHNEKENADINDLAAGCNVLLHSILDMAL